MSNNSQIKVNDALAELLKLEDSGVAYSDAFDVLAFLLDIPYNSVSSKLDACIDRVRLDAIIAKIGNGIPIAYITGRKEFYGREFKVTPDTLIPRADTEALINVILQHHGSSDYDLYITDLFTGSGCILITLLAELSGATGVGVDISSKALEIAHHNANTILNINSVFHRGYKFMKGDLSADEVVDRYVRTFINGDYSESNEACVHIITANPPYVSHGEYISLDSSLKCEPALALVADDDGYFFYKKLLCKLAKLGIIGGLSPSRYVYFEIGSTQASYLVQYADGLGLELNIEKDLAGKDRVLWCSI